MNELLKVTTNGNDFRPTVSARDLHGALGIGTEFAKWFQRMCEYGFQAGNDYFEVIVKNDENPKGGRPSTDYAIGIDMAKELCMIQRSEKGKQFRKYFIEVEKAWNSPEKVMARALLISEQKIKEIEGKNQVLLIENEQMKPKALFADAVSASDKSILIGELAKLIKQNGVDIGQNRLFQWMRDKGYLIRRKGTDYNMPTQYSMDLQLFSIKETTITHSDGHISISKTVKVTGKGQVYFINKFLAA